MLDSPIQALTVDYEGALAAFAHHAHEAGSLYLAGERYETLCMDPVGQVSWPELNPKRTASLYPYPFQTGVAGMLSFEGFMPHQPPLLLSMPRLAPYDYARVIVLDKQTYTAHQLVDTRRAEPWPASMWKKALERQRTVPGVHLNPLLSSKQYQAKIKIIQAYLRAGDAYQVNLGQPFLAKFQGIHAFDLFQYLQTREYMREAAYLCLGQGKYVVSYSPELLMDISTTGRIKSKPIKGTTARNNDSIKDRELAKILKASPKELAENRMIVDLVRHDLSSVCQAGSVEVMDFAALEKLHYVQHLVSTVEGTLAPQTTIKQAVKALFPAASITGAPKKRVIELIQALEGWGRGAWCGSLGFISSTGAARFNIAIRTLQIADNQILAWSGCGSTHLSDPVAEAEECRRKLGYIAKLG
jgi:para-aminobenzoate synthetase component I